MTQHKAKHRSNTPNATDPEYQKIVLAFGVNPGNPLPRLKKHNAKPLVFRRVYRQARR